MNMDYIAFCKNYYAATRIPIDLLKGNTPVYTTIGSMLSMPSYRTHEIDTSGLNLPCLNNYNPDIEYGMIEVKGTDLLIILGPNFGIHPTNELINEYMRELFIPPQERESIAEFLNTIPQISTVQFVRHLILIHQCINQETVDLSHFFGEGFSEETEKSTGEILRPEYEKEDEKHSTYVYELDLYERVRKGNVEDLKRHLNQVPLNLNANTLATTSLRQAKNLFIKTITNVVMIGAIPGGVSVDLAYALLDSYVQEAEKLSSVREIEMLCYNMLLEFQIMQEYLIAFAVGGTICALSQLLMDKTKLMPGRIMVILVVTGVVLGAFGIYEPFKEWAGAGASVPLLGFGNTLWKGVKKAVDEEGLLGIFKGGLTASSAGMQLQDTLCRGLLSFFECLMGCTS